MNHAENLLWLLNLRTPRTFEKYYDKRVNSKGRNVEKYKLSKRGTIQLAEYLICSNHLRGNDIGDNAYQGLIVPRLPDRSQWIYFWIRIIFIPCYFNPMQKIIFCYFGYPILQGVIKHNRQSEMIWSKLEKCKNVSHCWLRDGINKIEIFKLLVALRNLIVIQKFRRMVFNFRFKFWNFQFVSRFWVDFNLPMLFVLYPVCMSKVCIYKSAVWCLKFTLNMTALYVGRLAGPSELGTFFITSRLQLNAKLLVERRKTCPNRLFQSQPYVSHGKAFRA